MIRIAAESDGPQLYRLIAQLQRLAKVEVVPEAQFRRQLRRALADPRFRAFVVEESGVVRGVITLWLRENLFHGGRVALIDELIVEEGSRGRGIGGRLVEHVVEHCTRLGCTEVEVSTEADNLEARAFYARHGFIEQGVLLEREL
ncbi:MAG TPA: GNAT family N-acetyltransferase [Thermoflexia bacterium]|jgi:PhnO protein|nr:GNAT family N-acetyltransferase [Thermoflexia bacterium]